MANSLLTELNGLTTAELVERGSSVVPQLRNVTEQIALLQRQREELDAQVQTFQGKAHGVKLADALQKRNSLDAAIEVLDAERAKLSQLGRPIEDMLLARKVSETARELLQTREKLVRNAVGALTPVLREIVNELAELRPSYFAALAELNAEVQQVHPEARRFVPLDPTAEQVFFDKLLDHCVKVARDAATRNG